MAYVTRDYLSVQFRNFATRISTVFAKKTEIPAKVSELTNDAGYITNAVENLTNYYTKSDTYTKDEIASLIANVGTMSFKPVDELPKTDISATTIYLVPKTEAESSNDYIEYIYVSDKWEIIGETDMNLAGYVTSEELKDTLFSYVLKTDIEDSNIDFSAYFS